MKKWKKIKAIIKALFTPAQWFDQEYLNKSVIFVISFICIGVILGRYLYFPHFIIYLCIFTTIGIIARSAIHYYVKHFSDITTSLIKQDAAHSANAFYYKYVYSNSIYMVLPCLVVIIFGCGGCYMFDALSFNLLFVWVMILFTFVVYISIVGYIQYIFLALYIYRLASSKHGFGELSHSIHECIPAEIKWIQNLTKISHIYRNAFFSIGSMYIIAFGAFCYSPKFNANRDSLAFYVLWGIIAIAIVLVFPIVSVLENIWIKKIVEKIKNAYISHIKAELNILKKNSKKKKTYESYLFILENIYALRIKESRSYPINSIWSTGYSVALSLFNFLATIITVTDGIFPTFLDALRQNF